MSATLSTQTHLYAYSGTTAWADGDGMHTWIVRDWPLQLNNLGAYVNLRTSLVMSPRTAWPSTESPVGSVERITHSSSREIYMCQVPVVVPWHAKRMVWTAGIEGRSPGGTGLSVTQAKVYLSGTHYPGEDATSDTTAYAFDATLLATDYLSSSVALTISTTSTQYQLADDSTTGITPCVAPSFQLEDDTRLAYLILTTTAAGCVQRFSRVYDFTYWFLYE